MEHLGESVEAAERSGWIWLCFLWGSVCGGVLLGLCMESERIESTALLHGRFFSGEDLLGLGPDDWEVAAMFGLIALTYGLLALGFPGITVVIVTYLCASFAVVSCKLLSS